MPGLERPVDFDVTRTELGACVVVEVVGELDMTVAPRLRGELALAAEQRPSVLVVDLGEVTFIDAAGIGSLLTAVRAVADYGGHLTLARARRPVRRVLELLDLDEQLGLYSSAADVMGASDGRVASRDGRTG